MRIYLLKHFHFFTLKHLILVHFGTFSPAPCRSSSNAPLLGNLFLWMRYSPEDEKLCTSACSALNPSHMLQPVVKSLPGRIKALSPADKIRHISSCVLYENLENREGAAGVKLYFCSLFTAHQSFHHSAQL